MEVHIYVCVFPGLLGHSSIARSILLRYFYSISAPSCLVIRLLLYLVPMVDILDCKVTHRGQSQIYIPFSSFPPFLSHIYLWVTSSLSHSLDCAPPWPLTSVCSETPRPSIKVSTSLGRSSNLRRGACWICYPLSTGSPGSWIPRFEFLSNL